MRDKAQIAYNIIKDKILKGELPPLSDISEESLQDELDISRTPVREAIQKLKKEGFVYIYSRKGTIVSDITVDLTKSIYEVRALNEPYAARGACGKIPRERLLRMREAWMVPPADSVMEEQRDYFINLDRDLHNMILEYTDNKFLKDMLQVVNDHSHRIRLRISKRNRQYGSSIKDHIEIIEAFLEEDADRIEQRVRHHIEHAINEAFEYL
ncbi:GntR family transcriptional regulator [Kineothrix sp. MB12-C1]|uniref:GntR family transcriptional regulator n=1 Tax=Kineothrix sp. MB12-C1 TaxID=3070215 RepID=UPI0027D31C44|nr:GntR family transcriptional regulator [Kineothrix sp. MB12-C1]WMC92123.1 GntR family transcriptional regulator [Kineothrix sp. MB12-C1]